jgi:hypothetical protein
MGRALVYRLHPFGNLQNSELQKKSPSQNKLLAIPAGNPLPQKGTFTLSKSLKNLTTYYPHLIGIVENSNDSNLNVRVLLEEHCFSKENFQIVNSSKKWFIQAVSSITTL